MYVKAKARKMSMTTDQAPEDDLSPDDAAHSENGAASHKGMAPMGGF
jgi:hypothetical protein